MARSQYRTSAASGISIISTRHGDAPERLAFFAFDLLWLNGEDLRRRPLLERKATLAKLLRRAPERVVYSDHWSGDGRDLFRKVGEFGGEGIVSKRGDAPYRSGPSTTWLKCKHSTVGTFPVIGYVPDGKRIESLLVAEASPRGLRPVGRVEFWKPGVLNDDAREALLFLTRTAPSIRLRTGRGAILGGRQGGKEFMLTQGSIKALVSLIELRLSLLQITDREDKREKRLLESCRNELRSLLLRSTPGATAPMPPKARAS